MTARVAADRPDLRVHDLRHTGAVLAAQSGATRRADGAAEIAAALSRMALSGHGDTP